MTRAQAVTGGQITIGASDDSAAILRVVGAELRDPAKPLSLLIRFAVEAGDVEKVEASFDEARSMTLNEPGCRAYELNRDPRDPCRLVVFEQWRSLADLEAHFRKDYFATVRAELERMIVGTPELQVLLPTA
jgi:quinol monooxygenase YgiN